jgi:hypothetical protein
MHDIPAGLSRDSHTPVRGMPGPNPGRAAPIVVGMTKILRNAKRFRRARARWSPKALEFGAIPA